MQHPNPFRFHRMTKEQKLVTLIKGRCSAREFDTVCESLGCKNTLFDVADMLFENHTSEQKNIDGGSLRKVAKGNDHVYELYWEGRDVTIALERGKSPYLM